MISPLFFTALGDACPKLINLHLDGDIPFEFHQVMALVLGSKYNLLPQEMLNELNAKQAAISHLQFSPQSLSPICSTLQQLQTSYCCGIRLSIFAVVFILRHFVMLKECQSLFATVGAVTLLYRRQLQPNGNPMTSSSDELDLVQWTANSPFNGLTY